MASLENEENPPCSGIPEDFPQFNDRYTEKDEDYARTLRSELPPPPCVDNWYVRPKRTYDWTRENGRGRGRGGGGGRAHYAGRREYSDNRYNPYGRGGGGGGGGGYQDRRDHQNRGGYHDRRDRHYDQQRDNRRPHDHQRNQGGWNS